MLPAALRAALIADVASAGATAALYGAAVMSTVWLDTATTGSSAMISCGVSTSPGVNVWKRRPVRVVWFSHWARIGQPSASGVHTFDAGTSTKSRYVRSGVSTATRFQPGVGPPSASLRVGTGGGGASVLRRVGGLDGRLTRRPRRRQGCIEPPALARPIGGLLAGGGCSSGVEQAIRHTIGAARSASSRPRKDHTARGPRCEGIAARAGACLVRSEGPGPRDIASAMPAVRVVTPLTTLHAAGSQRCCITAPRVDCPIFGRCISKYHRGP